MTRRTNARLAGFLFLLYIAVGVTQMILGRGTRADDVAARLALMAQHAAVVRVNILLTLLTVVIAWTLAVSLYALTRDVDRDLARLGLLSRFGEGLLAALAPMASLGLLWLATSGSAPGGPDPVSVRALAAWMLKGRTWNYDIGASLFAVGSTAFSWLLLRGRLVPAALAWLGVIASALLVIDLPLDLVGFLRGPITDLVWLPVAVFEVGLAFWLILKGVREPAPAGQG